MCPVYICRSILSDVASHTDKLDLRGRRLTDAELESVLRALPGHARYGTVYLWETGSVAGHDSLTSRSLRT